MTAIAPLFIFLLIILVIGIFRFNFGMKRGSSSYVKRIWIVVACYLGILLFCAGLDAVLPAKGRYEVKQVNAKEVEKESFALYNAAVNGRINEIDPKLLVKKWVFDYQGGVLKVDSTSNEFYSLYIVIDRKMVNDGGLII